MFLGRLSRGLYVFDGVIWLAVFRTAFAFMSPLYPVVHLWVAAIGKHFVEFFILKKCI